MLPQALGSAFQNQTIQPCCWANALPAFSPRTSLAFGLLTAGMMVLFALPAIYAILDDMGRSTLAKERRQEAEAKAAQT